MAVNFQVFNKYSTRIDNTEEAGGSLERPVNFEITGIKYELVSSITYNTNAVMYNAHLTAWTYLQLESDFPVRFVITDNSTANFTMWLTGTNTSGRYGLPFILGNDNTTSTYVVNKVQVFNDDTVNTAKVRIVLFN